MSSEQIRYKIAAQKAPDFTNEFLVECPKCGGCAHLIPMGDELDIEQTSYSPHLSLNPKHFKCSQCRFSRSWNPEQPSFFRALVNWFGELSLYLQVSCGDQTIWALNAAHLEFIEEELRACAAGDAPVSEPLMEWLEQQSAEEIAACLARMKKVPASVS